VFLQIVLTAGGVQIDLDEPGWMTKWADYFVVKALWVLHWKDGSRPPVAMLVNDGEQGFYTARHIGMQASIGHNETIAYGLGKVLADGTRVEIVRMFPDGMAVLGTDVERIGLMMVRAAGPR
jgi:hypothetical protein